MAANAVARETIVALRHQIAKIEGTLPERLRASDDDAVVLRHGGRVLRGDGLLRTGVPALDEALGGGLPKAALTEIHGRQMRDAGAVAGLTLALVSMLLRAMSGRDAAVAPVLWIATGDMFAEAGFLYPHGLWQLFGIEPERFLLAEVPKPVDALWIAEEAAELEALATVVLELPGSPRQLDLTATRRLHRRAADTGRPVLLLRHSAQTQPTAAPLRFIVGSAPAGQRRILGRTLAGSIGPPAFAIELDKNSLAPPASFILEWKSDERTFEQRSPASLYGRAPDPLALVSVSPHGPDMAAASGSRVAVDQFRFPASGRQSK